jgi:hypothetical protein
VARVVLSHPLGISPLVGRYPANQVIPRRPRPGRRSFALPRSSGITPPLGGLSRTPGWVPTPYCPLRRFPPVARGFPRLACLIHAANVRSEPGSNPSKVFVSPSPGGGVLSRVPTAAGRTGRSRTRLALTGHPKQGPGQPTDGRSRHPTHHHTLVKDRGAPTTRLAAFVVAFVAAEAATWE